MTRQFDEGVREILMALLAIGATAYEYNYVKKLIDERPEPAKEKIVALQKAQEKIPSTKFDMSAQQVLDTLKQQKPILVKPNKTYPEQPKETPQTEPKVESKVDVVEYIKSLEDFFPEPTWDFKQYSIGYGTKAQPGDKTISREEAFSRLQTVVQQHKDTIERAAKEWGYNWNANQIAALTSFRFNLGSIGELTQNGSRTNEEIAAMIPEYDKAYDKKTKVKKALPGLTKRRKAEQELFLSK